MENYTMAYSEVLEVLKYLPKVDYDKIPKKVIQLLETNCDEKSEFTYNVALPLEEQNISKNAKVILAILYRTCWMKDEEKRELRQKENEYIKEKEQKKREIYNPNEIFNKKHETIKVVKDEDSCLQVVKKDNFFIRIIKKIKNIFKI